MQNATEYVSDQRAFHDQVAATAWDTFNWGRRAVREKYEADQIFALVGEPHRILQVGCGVGSQDPILASYDFVEEVHGVDPSPKTIERANSHFSHEKITRWVSGFKDLQENQRYDLTLSVDVFEHIDEPDAFIKKMIKVVKPGGNIVIITPNRLRWQNIALMTRGKPPVLLSALHYREYSVGDLRKLGHRHGLRYVGYFGEEFYGPGATSLGIDRSIMIGKWLKPISHVIGVVFKTTSEITKD